MDEINTIEIKEEITNCNKGFKTIEEISNGFDADDICMGCVNITYKDGVVSCKYAKVN